MVRQLKGSSDLFAILLFGLVCFQALVMLWYMYKYTYLTEGNSVFSNSINRSAADITSVSRNDISKDPYSKEFSEFSGNWENRPEWCNSKQSFLDKISFDPFEKSQTSSSVQLYGNPSPFDCTLKYKYKYQKRTFINSDTVLIPERVWSKSLGTHKYGGFTADLGWILMAARYGIMNSISVNFPPYWGHGCLTEEEKEPKWTCFFKEITPARCMKDVKNRKSAIQESRDDRHLLKLTHIYNDDPDSASRLATRNEKISAYAGSWLRADNDAQAMRQVFRWVFRLREETRALVNEAKKNLDLPIKQGTRYVSVHIRWGDKVGNTNRDRIKEASFVPTSTYVDTIRCFYENTPDTDVPHLVFVATDDYAAVDSIKNDLGPGFKVITSAKPSDAGFSISSYRDKTSDMNISKFMKAVRLWADLEILSEAEVFVGNLQSNVARTVHLMRLGKPVNTSLTVPLAKHPSKSCCAKNLGSSLMVNCFNLCA